MTFEELGLSKETLKSVVAMGFEEPTPIQAGTIPPILQGKDVIGQAQTGTGKTAAFGIPIVDRCMKGKKPFALILEPTRELAMQVAEEINKIGKYKRILALPVYGGASILNQIKAMRRGVDVIVGTPGRVLDHIGRGTLDLSDVKMAVLDESDEMLDMGFIDDIKEILKATPTERQTLLFSATMPEPIFDIAKRHMRTPEKIRLSPKDMVVPEIKQVFYEVRMHEKIEALARLLDVEDTELTLIFCHTKKDVDELCGKLQQIGYNASALHGDYTQARRDEVMDKFRKGKIDILVATDVAARGLDIQNVSHVINYSIPQNPESYVHRIGRTGRAGKSGIAITFVTPREYNSLRLIERSAKTTISRKKLPSLQDALRAREKSVATELAEVIRENRHQSFVSVVESLTEEFSFADIAAAALFTAYGEPRTSEEISSFDRGSERGKVRLFMTIGRKDNIRIPDIVQSIAHEAKVPSSKIGSIKVFDKFTFVEVPAEIADLIIGSLNEIMVKGKRVRVRQAEERGQETVRR
ncbi:MAG TPA: DEAD/DEAH box helicase [Dissulfurispiraceae bacterium]|nr:DEAD/DEAH box helicase [Dissulfurispiraceae bacterium]